MWIVHLYVNTDGTPKHDIQWNNKASTQSFVLVAERGIASAQFVDLLMMVKYVWNHLNRVKAQLYLHEYEKTFWKELESSELVL